MDEIKHFDIIVNHLVGCCLKEFELSTMFLWILEEYDEALTEDSAVEWTQLALLCLTTLKKIDPEDQYYFEDVTNITSGNVARLFSRYVRGRIELVFIKGCLVNLFYYCYNVLKDKYNFTIDGILYIMIKIHQKKAHDTEDSLYYNDYLKVVYEIIAHTPRVDLPGVGVVLLDKLLPNVRKCCYICGEQGVSICSSCARELRSAYYEN